MRSLIGALLIATLIPAPATAQKTRVRAEFRILDPSYVAFFSDDERVRLERDAAQLVADHLADRLPILEMVTGDTAAYVLRVELNRRGGADANPLEADRGLIASLEGPDGARPATWWGLFRKADAAGSGFDSGDDTLPADRLFLHHIQLAIESADVNALVRDQISAVPIAEDGRIWAPPPGEFGWVAPLLRQQLCLAEGTSLLIQVFVPSPFDPDPSPRIFKALVESDFDAARAFGGQVPPSFRGFEHGVFARPDSLDQAGMDQLLQSDSVRVQRIFLQRFERDPGICERAADPLAAEELAGGGS